MIDIFNLPNNDSNVDIFTNNGGTTYWRTWVKPKNAKFIHILAIVISGYNFLINLKSIS